MTPTLADDPLSPLRAWAIWPSRTNGMGEYYRGMGTLHMVRVAQRRQRESYCASGNVVGACFACAIVYLPLRVNDAEYRVTMGETPMPLISQSWHATHDMPLV